MSEQGSERTEEATPRRKQQARKKGTVAKSNDLNGSLVLFGLILVLPSAFGVLGQGFMAAITRGLGNIPRETSIEALGPHILAVLQPALLGVAMIAGTAMLIGVFSNFAQVGFVLSAETLTPNLNKINPANGLKRMFSFSSTFDGLKAAAKCGIFIWLGYSAIQSSWPELLRLGYLTPIEALVTVGGIVKSIAFRIAFVWLALAVLDYFVQRKQVDKQLKMTKDEVKREMKEAESSPEMKMAQARMRHRLKKGRMLDAVKTADVVVTNPTHFAVAIKYDPEKSHAPTVVAKGADFLAAKIREAASESRVPIVPNPPLARALYKQCEIGDFVPRELFQPVAEVLAFVYKTLKKVRR